PPRGAKALRLRVPPELGTVPITASPPQPGSCLHGFGVVAVFTVDEQQSPHLLVGGLVGMQRLEYWVASRIASPPTLGPGLRTIGVKSKPFLGDDLLQLPLRASTRIEGHRDVRHRRCIPLVVELDRRGGATDVSFYLLGRGIAPFR